MWLRDTGILEKNQNDIIRKFRPPGHNPTPEVTSNSALVITQLGIIMIVLAVGLILSIPVFLCEAMRGRAPENIRSEIKRNIKE